MSLSKYVEQISDDFQSTFSVVSENTLTNMIGFPKDYCQLIDIVRKYIPGAKLSFIKTNTFPDDQYDLYQIILDTPLS